VVNLFLAWLIIGQLLRPGFWQPPNPLAVDLGMPTAHILLRMTHELPLTGRPSSAP
jgi:hypothetical protein